MTARARWLGAAAVSALAVTMFLTNPRGTASAEDSAGLRLELGITLALSGREAEADSAFTSVLSIAPSDPRALNNLGNVRLMRGDAALAVAFYERAAQIDSSDSGILLNRVVALLLSGNEAEALASARTAVHESGGATSARFLLGIRERHAKPAPDKAAERAALTEDEISVLLDAAAEAVPVDSTAAADSANVPLEPAPPRAPVWRSAGPRAAERTEIATMLYWKR